MRVPPHPALGARARPAFGSQRPHGRAWRFHVNQVGACSIGEGVQAIKAPHSAGSGGMVCPRASDGRRAHFLAAEGITRFSHTDIREEGDSR